MCIRTYRDSLRTTVRHRGLQKFQSAIIFALYQLLTILTVTVTVCPEPPSHGQVFCALASANKPAAVEIALMNFMVSLLLEEEVFLILILSMKSTRARERKAKLKTNVALTESLTKDWVQNRKTAWMTRKSLIVEKDL